MDFKSVGKKVVDLAPALGAALLGPAGAAGGLAVKALASAFGLKDDALPEEIEAMISGDPEALLKLRIAEYDFQAKRLEAENQALSLQLQDTANARGRQTEHERSLGKTDVNVYILAWVIVIGFFILIALLMCVELPDSNSEAVAILIGAVAAGFGAVWQYFFGSSKSSREKTEIMSRLGVGEGKR